MQFTFDPRKDAANIIKHGLSLSDAPLVFNAVNKLTIESTRGGEDRLMDVALVEVAGVVLVLRGFTRRRAINKRTLSSLAQTM